MRPFLFQGVMFTLFLTLSFQSGFVSADAPVIRATVIKTYPHDPKAFTQGLVFDGERLYESVGLYGRSEVRELDLMTLRPIRRQPLNPRLFGEGLAVVDQQLWQLTWQGQQVLRYEADDFTLLPAMPYAGEGWGLTWSGQAFVMSNGSNHLEFRSKENFSLLKRISVADGRKPVMWLNELEWVNGHIWANVWRKDQIAIIDPENGQVLAWVDISELKAAQPRATDVSNGIAWRSGSDWVLVTGKLWPKAYAIAIPELP